MLLVQAAKVILMRPHNWPKFSFGEWLTKAAERMHKNKLAVALANKLARIAWSVLRNGKAFDVQRDEVMAGIWSQPSSKGVRERRKAWNGKIRPQSLTALSVIMDLAANETKVRA